MAGPTAPPDPVPGFQGPLRLEYLNGRWWRLTEPLVYLSRTVAVPITIPAGFLTDFASIPRFFWRLLPPTGPYGEPAVLHDYLYRMHRVSRLEADDLFLEAMARTRVSRPIRTVLYWAVRLFGRHAYEP